MKKKIVIAMIMAGCMIFAACGKKEEEDAGIIIEDLDSLIEQDSEANAEDDDDEVIEVELLEDMSGAEADEPIDVTEVVVDAEEAYDNMMAGIDGIPGVPDADTIDEGLFSYMTWAGLQFMYEGMEFDSLNEDAAVGMAAYAAQYMDDQPEYTADGCNQIISAEEMEISMKALFGKTFDASKVSAEAQEKSKIEVQSDGSVYVGLGDWGLVVPQVETNAIDKVNEDDKEFYVSARFYAYDLENSTEMEGIPCYVCNLVCEPDETSPYGYIIIDLKMTIIE